MTYTPYGWLDAPNGWQLGDPIPTGYENSEINAVNLEAFGAAILGQVPQGGHTVKDEGSGLTQRANLNFVGAGVTATDNSGTSSTDITISGQLYSAVTRTPEQFGARRDGRQIAGVAMTSGSGILTATAEAPFVSGDVGKAIHVRGAAGSNIGLTTTIASYQSATQVTLTANASATVTAQTATYGTDDTAAWVAAIADAVSSCQADRTYYCQVVGSNGIYMIAAAATKGGSTLGNSQIPLPIVPPATGQKVTLRIGGAQDSATVSHWDQTVPQKSGCCLFSTLTGQTSDGTYGVVSVLGSPTVAISSGPTEDFSNMKVIIDGLSVVAPFNPSVIGVDMRRVAQCDVLNLSCLGDATPDTDGPNPTFVTKPTNSIGVGLYMPRPNNNDSANVGVYHCEGWYYGIGFSDHFTAIKLLIVYCNTAIFISNVTGGGVHGAVIQYASVEACGTCIEAGLGGTTKYPLVFHQLDTEIIGGTIGTYDIIDTNNALRGYIGWVDNSLLRDPRINGGKQIKVENLMTSRGVMASQPGVPLTGGGTVNISTISQASSAVVTTSSAHGLTTGQSVVISGVTGTQVITNGCWTVTVTDSTHFSIPVSTTSAAYVSGGVVTFATAFFRDAMVVINANGATITAVNVDGTATGLLPPSAGPPQAMSVPSGRQVSLAYSGATPTWTWTLL